MDTQHTLDISVVSIGPCEFQEQLTQRNRQLWILCLRIFHKIDSIVILQRVYQHTQGKVVAVAKVQIISPRSGSIVVLLSPTHQNEGKQTMTPDDPKMRDKDRTCFTFQPACLCPSSCAARDDRQMRMTDKGQGTLFSRIATTGLIDFDRVRTTHDISSFVFPSLRLLHLLLWSQVTFVRFTVHFSHRQLLIFIHD